MFLLEIIHRFYHTFFLLKRVFTVCVSFDKKAKTLYNTKGFCSFLLEFEGKKESDMTLQPIAKHIPMVFRKWTQHFVVGIWRFYLWLLSLTSKVEFEGLEYINEDCMLGFWHEDSYCMQLVLKELRKRNKVLHVIVTAERRGDYISEMVTRFGHVPVRLPDGMKMRGFMRELKEESKKKRMDLGVALDGPSGPYRKPKRLLFLLAQEAGKKVLYIRFEKKGMISLPWRWDKYRIPLVFKHLKCKVDEFGFVEQSDLRSFDEYVERKFGDDVCKE